MPTRSRLIALLAVAAAAIALAGCSAAAPARPVAAEGTAAAAPAGRAKPQVVAIGDSIAFGKGVRPDEAWPALIAAQHGWTLTNLAVSGSGFVKPGWNGDTYRQQVDTALGLHPDYILIAATRNDRGQDPALVASSADELLGELHDTFPRAHIIGITAVWGADKPPATVATVDGIVQEAVTDVGGTFLDIGYPLARHPELVQADGIHPNAAGERIVATTIEDRLAPLGVTS
ncbi:SGNH/GDSL hydrolase family protein [Leifsonia shinshuensis]|uniref:SGNH/GDSL hydrolase family protein n=1 Tax=Leifsonia shinshuensis TaxID=150026 RepID=UPI001F50E1CA|nr:GDSL-type esterase/lipase family protein [Leifsonia shinshuensis]